MPVEVSSIKISADVVTGFVDKLPIVPALQKIFSAGYYAKEMAELGHFDCCDKMDAISKKKKTHLPPI